MFSQGVPLGWIALPGCQRATTGGTCGLKARARSFPEHALDASTNVQTWGRVVFFARVDVGAI